MDLIRAQSGTTLFACGMLVFAICQVYSGAWTIGTLIPFGSWMYMLINLADRLTESESAVSKCLSSIKTLREVLDEPAAVTDKPDALNFAPDGPVSVEFDRVSFSYPNQEAEGPPKPVLRNVSFTVEHGEKVAIIGPSGTGKTTLLHKVLRSRDPDSGRVLINGLDLRDLKQATFKRVVSYVPQGAPLFDETLRNLMLYAVPPDARSQITDELIWATLRLVKADLGPRFDKGLETKIGRDGIELSGGERQRLSAAMALMNPHLRLLVMDEPTSNLDAETQAAFHDGLSDAVASGVTTFVVAHRLSTVRDCDRFVVLKPAAELAENETQVEAVARSFGELNRISPTFRKVAKSEGLTLTAKDQTTELGDFNRLFGAKPVIGQA
jgi:ABC-type multidrug transport system fused ATPase/permease subunit